MQMQFQKVTDVNIPCIHTLISLLPCGLLAIFGLNAFGLRSKVASTASRLAASFSTLL